jgi:hypothetical protein
VNFPIVTATGLRVGADVQPGARITGSTHPGAAAALAFDDLVALLEQALALAILALLLFLDVGTFLACHDVLQTAIKQGNGAAQYIPIALTGGGIPVYKRVGPDWAEAQMSR